MEGLNINIDKDEETGEEIFCPTLHSFILAGVLFNSRIVNNQRMVTCWLGDGETKLESEMDYGDCPLGGDPCLPEDTSIIGNGFR